MNEEQGMVSYERDRRAWRARFFSQLHRYRNLLRRRWWVLVVCAGLALAGMAAYARYAPLKYVSQGEMIVSIKLNIQQGQLYTEELGNFLGTQAALMQGSEVQQRARDRVASQNPNLAACPVLLNVNVLPRTTIFVLLATGVDPEYTKLFLQACMEEFI